MKYNPFIITPYRSRQPARKPNACSCNPTGQLINGMVSLGSIAVLGGVTVGIANAFQK